MKQMLQVLFSTVWVLFASLAWSADKVTVIPLWSSDAKGGNKQVQYNDYGKTAGAEIYYDKSTTRLGLGTDTPSYQLHVKDSRSSYLVGIHNTSTSGLAKGLIVRADGGDPLIIQGNNGDVIYGIASNGYSYLYGTSIVSTALAVGGVLPSHTLTVNGTAAKPGGGTWSDTSDVRLKKNIDPLVGALAKITSLQGVTYQWVNPEDHGGKDSVQAGFVAQDVEKVFPLWVAEVDPTGKDRELVAEGGKVKSLGLPHGFNAYLVEAIRELKAENDALKELVCIDHPNASLCR